MGLLSLGGLACGVVAGFACARITVSGSIFTSFEIPLSKNNPRNDGERAFLHREKGDHTCPRGCLLMRSLLSMAPAKAGKPGTSPTSDRRAMSAITSVV